MDILDQALETSQDKDGENEDCIPSPKIISTQTLAIVEDDGSLGSAEDQSAVAELTQSQDQDLLDPLGEEYHIRSNDGNVTYRVVQVGPSGPEAVEPMAQIVSSPGYSAAGGQFYVIGSPHEVFGTQSSRSLVPRGVTIESSRGTTSRDDRRKQTHNEVERRRRDKINNWIIKLSKIIPDCANETAKTGQSKSVILAKACEYIIELRTSNQRLIDRSKEGERASLDLELSRQLYEEMKRDNNILRAQLNQHGIIPSTDLNYVKEEIIDWN